MLKGANRFLIIMLFALSTCVQSVSAHSIENEIEVACRDWPYIFITNGEFTGLSYEITKAVFERAKLSFRYEIYPWARLYYYGLNRKNFAIGCLERAYWREKDFYWVGVVNSRVMVHFYKKAGNPRKANTLYELKGHRIGVQRDSYYERFLRDNSFTNDEIVPISSHAQLLLMLDSGRVDFILVEDVTANGVAGVLGFTQHDFEKVLLAYSTDVFLALSKKTPKETYVALKKAYQELLQEGVIQQITRAYNLD